MKLQNRSIRLIQLRRLGLMGALAASVFLSACGSGSGAKVETNVPPINTGGSDNFVYSGQKPAATDDITKFQNELWVNIARPDRCGSCHATQTPTFARGDDINLAYNEVISNGLVTLSDPASSRMVIKVSGGHNCWTSDPVACGDILAGWISKWAGPHEVSANDITLKAPEDKEIASSKSFPIDSSGFATTVYPLLSEYCSRCHSETAVTKQQPYFASSNVNAAYEAAKSKIRLDNPAASRLVQRLRTDFHNCWSDCQTNSNEMEAAIKAFSDSLTPVEVDPELVVSKAVSLGDAFILTSGGRIDTDIIAKYEFKQAKGTVALDTSGVDPAADLNLFGNVAWSSAWGIKLADSGRAQATTAGSKKLFDLLRGTGEYTLETWVIPDSVDQGMNDNNPARILSYSGSTSERNFTLGQYNYNYSILNRTDKSDANGEAELATNDNDERVQASLQHVVVTFDPVNGRRIYVNGEFTGDADPEAGAVLKDWDNGYALVVGNEVSGNRPWKGSVRFVAIHKRAMTAADIKTNFDVGVGAKYLLLFNVSELIDLPGSYLVFEVQQLDEYGYQFAAPFFTNLNGSTPSSDIPLKGIRIGVNGVEAPSGQVFANLNTSISKDAIVDGRQPLSTLGTVVEAKSGPDTDIFFLTFDQIGSHSYNRVEPATTPPAAPADVPDQADMGLRDFAEINASLAQMTGVAQTSSSVMDTYTKVKQQLPALTNLDSFLAAQQMGITQLTVAYCNALVDSSSLRASFFPGFDFSAGVATAFNSSTKRDQIIEPLLSKLIANEQPDGSNPDSALSTQAAPAKLRLELNQLIDGMVSSCGSDCSANRTLTSVKASCAAAMGSAVMLLQ